MHAPESTAVLVPADLELPGVTHRRVPVGAVSLHIAEAGPVEGPLVVLLHGFPEFWWSWRRQIEGLSARGFRVVAPDLRGYGDSDKPAPDAGAYAIDALAGDVRGLVALLLAERGQTLPAVDSGQAARVTLVCHDWGGVVGWATAALHPEAVGRLVACNAPHLPAYLDALRKLPIQIARSWYVLLFQCKGLVELTMRAHPHAMLARTLKGAAARREAFPREEVARYARALTRPGVLESSLAYYRSIPGHIACLDRLASPIRAPTLVLWGRQDPALDARLVAFCRPYVHAPFEVRWFEEAGHWVQQEDAEGVTDAIAGFAIA
ncbi:MAG: alpha/beta hydrolase [Myxococcales bacterium]|nr:alpha/beta hydrolase [Myxococcales bacterium]